MPKVAWRLREHDTNPCLLESDVSTRGRDENNYDRERWSTYFLNYKSCQKFWNSIMGPEKTEWSKVIYAYSRRKR
ncbi:coiled-coil-helix-coiled-coil-helix domain-containing protein 7-like [Canis lupus familiaris]|nr:coiled-coil-helix-coiled-coil-helix domain-containing protein 7-like [Canis lupus dingo]XP_038292096.1 coiled-coil-helix-coiled-coil-helix domain-containing protein 7-like [Canis lupus familiaris]XP_038315141.1 coiled-coil-helix-coiled-coil-helix domain-containing protein 7-like [Canis lupus familiaris]